MIIQSKLASRNEVRDLGSRKRAEPINPRTHSDRFTQVWVKETCISLFPQLGHWQFCLLFGPKVNKPKIGKRKRPGKVGTSSVKVFLNPTVQIDKRMPLKRNIKFRSNSLENKIARIPRKQYFSLLLCKPIEWIQYVVWFYYTGPFQQTP